MADTSRWTGRVIATGEGWLPVAALLGALWLFASAATDLPPTATPAQSPAAAHAPGTRAVPHTTGTADQAARQRSSTSDGTVNGGAAAAAFRQ
jgi:hypothetical protein